MKRKLLFIILIFFFSFLSLFFSCDDSTGPPYNNAKINLTLEDVSCTEVWLKLQVDNPALKSDVTIYRDNVEITKINNIIGNDTIIFDEGLLPNKGYNYRAKKIISESEFIESEEIKAHTMDTTSHNFTFETYTFGERTSILYDVAIIDENNIWAVGEIYMNDSLGNPDPIFYNAIHWDGSAWELKRIFYKGGIWTIRAIFAFNENDIWFSGYVRYYNGNFIDLPIPDILMGWGINKLWGTSSNDLYVVGNSGSIAHYQNGRWSKIESGTTTNLMDIYGDGDNVFICGYQDFQPTVLLKYNNGKLTKVIEEDHFEYKTDYISGWIKSIWVKRDKIFSLTFYDLYRSNVETKGEGKALWRGDINLWGSNGIRGNEINNIFTIGYHGILWHFNGIDWITYNELVNQTDQFYSIAVKGNIVILAGEHYINGIERFGLITIGKR